MKMQRVSWSLWSTIAVVVVQLTRNTIRAAPNSPTRCPKGTTENDYYYLNTPKGNSEDLCVSPSSSDKAPNELELSSSSVSAPSSVTAKTSSPVELQAVNIPTATSTAADAPIASPVVLVSLPSRKPTHRPQSTFAPSKESKSPLPQVTIASPTVMEEGESVLGEQPMSGNDAEEVEFLFNDDDNDFAKEEDNLMDEDDDFAVVEGNLIDDDDGKLVDDFYYDDIVEANDLNDELALEEAIDDNESEEFILNDDDEEIGTFTEKLFDDDAVDDVYNTLSSHDIQQLQQEQGWTDLPQETVDNGDSYTTEEDDNSFIFDEEEREIQTQSEIDESNGEVTGLETECVAMSNVIDTTNDDSVLFPTSVGTLNSRREQGDSRDGNIVILKQTVRFNYAMHVEMNGDDDVAVEYAILGVERAIHMYFVQTYLGWDCNGPSDADENSNQIGISAIQSLPRDVVSAKSCSAADHLSRGSDSLQQDGKRMDCHIIDGALVVEIPAYFEDGWHNRRRLAIAELIRDANVAVSLQRTLDQALAGTYENQNIASTTFKGITNFGIENDFTDEEAIAASEARNQDTGDDLIPTGWRFTGAVFISFTILATGVAVYIAKRKRRRPKLLGDSILNVTTTNTVRNLEPSSPYDDSVYNTSTDSDMLTIAPPSPQFENGYDPLGGTVSSISSVGEQSESHTVYSVEEVSPGWHSGLWETPSKKSAASNAASTSAHSGLSYVPVYNDESYELQRMSTHGMEFGLQPPSQQQKYRDFKSKYPYTTPNTLQL